MFAPTLPAAFPRSFGKIPNGTWKCWTRKSIRSSASASSPRRWIDHSARFRRATAEPSVGAAQATHGELDLAAGQLPPAFHHAHVAGLGIAGEEGARGHPRLLARQRERLAHIAIVRLSPSGHPTGKIARRGRHDATPDTGYDPARYRCASCGVGVRGRRPAPSVGAAGL